MTDLEIAVAMMLDDARWQVVQLLDFADQLGGGISDDERWDIIKRANKRLSEAGRWMLTEVLANRAQFGMDVQP